MIKKILAILIIIVSLSNLKLSAQTDTIHVYIKGYFNSKEKYLIEYVENGNKKHYEFGKKQPQLTFNFVINSNDLDEYGTLNLKIKKYSKKHGWRTLRYRFAYDKVRNHILIYYMSFEYKECNFQTVYLEKYYGYYTYD